MFPLRRRKLGQLDLQSSISPSDPDRWKSPRNGSTTTTNTEYYSKYKLNYEDQYKEQQLQKKKAAVLKAGLAMISEKRDSMKPQRARIRTDEYTIIDRSIDERVAHCRYLQYEVGEDLFNMQYTTIHKAAMDGDLLGIKHFLQIAKSSKGKVVDIDNYDRTGKLYLLDLMV